MTGYTRKKTEISNRRQQVSERYLRGMYMSQIADELGVDTATVSRDLTELRKEWLDRSVNHIDQRKAIELVKVDRLEITYWEAWECSLKDAETHIEESSSSGDKSVHKREGQSGNPAFLAGVMSCINKRCTILGLDAPRNLDIKSGGEPLKGNDVGLDRAVSTLADAIREAIYRPDAETSSSVVTPEQTPVVGPAEQS